MCPTSPDREEYITDEHRLIKRESVGIERFWVDLTGRNCTGGGMHSLHIYPIFPLMSVYHINSPPIPQLHIYLTRAVLYLGGQVIDKMRPDDTRPPVRSASGSIGMKSAIVGWRFPNRHPKAKAGFPNPEWRNAWQLTH